MSQDPEVYRAEYANRPYTPAEIAAATSPVFADLASEVKSTSQSHLLGEASVHQRVVYALLARTLMEYRSDRLMLIISYFFIPIILALGYGLGFGLTAGMGWFLSLVGIGDWLVIMFAPLAALFGISLRSNTTDADVALRMSDNKIQMFKLGRLELAFELFEPHSNVFFFGIVAGMQHALLIFSPGKLGLPIEQTWSQCGLVTLDNVLHGIFLDTCELYDLYWGKKLEHNWWSATVFFAFRLAFDAFGFLMLFSLWKRYHLFRFFRDYPKDDRDVSGVIHWIDRRCGDEEKWPQRYHDEFLFLLLCREFIQGDYDFVQHLSTRLSRLQVEPKVRELFRAPQGKVVFEGSG